MGSLFLAKGVGLHMGLLDALHVLQKRRVRVRQLGDFLGFLLNLSNVFSRFWLVWQLERKPVFVSPS